MAYTKNPYLPKLRAKAVTMLRDEEKSVRQVARYFGVSPGTISKWNKKAPPGNCHRIATSSSRPKSHPRKLDGKIVERIIELRRDTKGRCGEVIHKLLENEGVHVSLSSVKRTLDRQYLLKKKSPWKRLHKYMMRPEAVNPGDLVQVDTIHLMQDKKTRIYVYTLIDVSSRWAYAHATDKISTGRSVDFVRRAQTKAGFDFKHVQSDWGPEFSRHFTDRVKISHRHSRVRKPNDNAHLERFNRTLQDELIRSLPVDVKIINRQLRKYLNYYNEERLHLGINLSTPLQVLTKCFQAID